MALENIVGYAGAKEIIDNFKFSGDWEKDHINLSNALQHHYYDSVGVYNDGIQKAIETDVNARLTHYLQYVIIYIVKGDPDN